MKLNSGFEDKKARIEMIPLIDVTFLLLVFFIYAMLSMTLHRGLKIELPQASTSEIDRSEYISITITQDNSIFLDKERIELDKLLNAVRERLKCDDRQPVFINGDKKADLGIAIEILDLLRSGGVEEVSFECIKERE